MVADGQIRVCWPLVVEVGGGYELFLNSVDRIRLHFICLWKKMKVDLLIYAGILY